MKIFCLNLERATDRKLKMIDEWVINRHFEIEFFSAYDRRLLEAGHHKFPYHEADAISAGGKPLSFGEIANITSLILLYEHALQQGYEEIVLMEDDIVPYEFTTPQLMAAAIKACKQTFPRVSVLIMHEPNSFARTTESKNNISLLSVPPFGNLCVWLNKKAMQMLVKDLKRMLFPSDWLWARRMAPMKLMAIMNQPLCHHSGANTYIHTTNTPNRLFIP